VITAWPALDVQRTLLRRDLQGPLEDEVYSSKSGVWPGSTQPEGLVIFAIADGRGPSNDAPDELLDPLGLFPAASMIVGLGIGSA